MRIDHVYVYQIIETIISRIKDFAHKIFPRSEFFKTCQVVR